MEEEETSAVEATGTSAGLDDVFWNDLLARIEEGEVVPVVGPGAVTFGLGDELLYPWLAERIPQELDPPLAFEKPPRELQEVVHAQLAKGKPLERICRRIRKIVEEPDLRPGSTLAAIAAVEGFKLFINTTFDPLLSRAVESASPGGQPEERHGATSLRLACPDLPQELRKLKHRFVYQILGRADDTRDFVLWDEDLLAFLLRLNERLQPTVLPRLREALQTSHFLVFGISLTDWVLRFFVQIIKQERLSELHRTEKDLYVFEKLEPAERDKVVVYFGRLTKQIRILAIDPRDFIAELHDRWRKKHPAPLKDPYAMSKEHREKHRARGCIFVSYASPDLEIARYFVSQLQKAGCLVWFDKEQLQLGENWEEGLREAVDERCGLFVSLISERSASKLEGYTLFERKLAAKRQQERFADHAIFYLPVRIDEADPLIPQNEPRGTKAIQGVRKSGGHLEPEFIGYLREKQRENCTALGYPLPLG